MTVASRLLALGWLVACGGPPPGAADSGSATGSSGGAPVGSTGTPSGSTTTGGGATTATAVEGVLVDPSGAPLAGEDVLCCTEVTCIQLDSDADGAFRFNLEPGARVSLKTHTDLFRIPRWGSALAPVLVPTSGAVAVGELYVPDLPPGAVLASAASDPQTLSTGDGLVLTLNRGDLHPEFGVVLNDVASRSLAEARWPTYDDLAGREVVAVYALHPFGTTSDSLISVTAPTNLPADTAVSFWSVYHLGGDLFGPVPGTSDGSVVSTDPGAGIDLLTHLVITVP